MILKFLLCSVVYGAGRRPGDVDCGPEFTAEGEVVVGCFKRVECASPDGDWHLCPEEVNKIVSTLSLFP